jgi:hypothetical protein
MARIFADGAEFGDLLADIACLEELKKLFKDLSENLSLKTKRVVVPFGTTVWYVNIVEKEPTFWKYQEPSEVVETKVIRIPLSNVFGHHIGYNAEVNTLVIAAEKMK